MCNCRRSEVCLRRVMIVFFVRPRRVGGWVGGIQAATATKTRCVR